MEEKRTILVTGGMGFLGSHLIEYGLNNSEDNFLAVTLNHESFLNKESDRLEIKEAEYIFSKECQERKIDFIINCAYPRNLDGYMVADGLKYTERVFLAAKQLGVKGIINISSQSVYSQTRDYAATEESPICLESPYAVGKYMCELLLNNVCKDIPHTNIRLASLIGPGFDQRIVNRMVKDALSANKIVVNKSDEVFGFLDIEDAVYGIYSLLGYDVKKWGDVYNLGSDGAYSLVDMGTLIQDVFKENLNRIIEIETKSSENKLNTSVNSEKLYKATGYEPKVLLKNSIEKILENIIAKNEK